MPLNIIFMGTPDFAIPALDLINKSKHNILSVYTQPPKKKGRGLKINISAVHKYSKDKGLNINHPENLMLEKEIENLSNLKPDVVVVVAYGKILPTKLLNLKNIKFINIHASLLPKWRGAAPIQRAIMNLDKETGISIMKIVPELDAGPILMSEKVDINVGTNFIKLSDQLSKLGAKMIIKSLEVIEKKNEKYIPQDEKKATYAKKIEKLEAKINWNEKAKNILAKINALSPNPGSWFEVNGSRIKPIKAIEVNFNGNPGEVLNNDFTIACSQNAIQILELQKEGKQPVKAKDYLRGNKLQIGSNLNSNV